MNEKEIFIAGGCFWGTEHFFKQIYGVISTQTGYANSKIPHPSYQEVRSESTNAAETVKVIYNPSLVSLNLLLDLYFKTIDPTSINKQGIDSGTQYRTGIYFTDKNDKTIIDTALQQLQKKYAQPIMIESKELVNFYPAEEFHQDYLEKNPKGYCHINLELLKLAKEANRK